MRNMCKKAAQKLGVLNRISSFLDPEKKKLVFDVHYGCALNCPLTWMFNSRKPNKLVNRNHERSLYKQCMMMQEASTFKGFYDLVKVSVFGIAISDLNYRR